MRDHDTDHDAEHATIIRASRDGGAGKWLLGAVAAVVLSGGGYFAWNNYAPQESEQTAYNDTYSSDQYDGDALRAGPVEPGDDTLAETASVSPPTETRRTPARRADMRTSEVPEATIGVTPANVTTEEAAVTDASDLVVTAPPRPIWVRTPSERRLTSLYPARALQRGREGEARLNCTVLAGGALDCTRAEATPGGFGNAALRVARSLRHSPTLADGSDATGTPVNLRVVFRLEDERRRG